MTNAKRSQNAKRGITLISLVITIVILIILAGVAINLAVDSDGLFSKAEGARNEWNEKVAEEGSSLENIMAMLNGLGGGTSVEPDVPTEPEQPDETPDTDAPTAPTAITTESATETTIAVKATGGTDTGSGVAGYKYSIDNTNWSETVAEKETYSINYATLNTVTNEYDATTVPTVVGEGTRTAPIPAGYTVSGESTENTISQGLVIYENTNRVVPTIYAKTVDVAGNESDVYELDNRKTYNQYVWIPVDDINDMVMCSECKGTSRNLVYNDTTKTLTCTNTHADGTTPTLVGKLYTTCVEGGNTYTEVDGNYIYTSHQNFTYTGQEYSDTYTGKREPAVVTGSDGTSYDGATDDYHGLADANAFLTQLQGDFTNMAKSVAKYKGFYVGRYEAGANGATKKGQAVMTAGTDNQMWYGLHNTLRSNPEIASSTYSQMIWGSQYDQMIKFLEEDATNEPYIGHTDRGLSSSPAVSGDAPLDEMSNIYDLEGNYWEWTAEADYTRSRVLRGRSLLRSGRWRFQSSQLPL